MAVFSILYFNIFRTLTVRTLIQAVYDEHIVRGVRDVLKHRFQIVFAEPEAPPVAGVPRMR